MPISKISVRIPVVILKDKGNFIAYTPVFKLYGKGDSIESSTRSLKKHTEKFFKFYLNNNTLEKKLSSLGWIRREHSINLPSESVIPTCLLDKGPTFKKVSVNIPIPS